MDFWLPPFLCPFMDYLKANLPQPLYFFVVKVVAQAYTAATAIIRLTLSLIYEHPSAETLLPPIITLVAAYLALASLYRTASWAIRLTLFFLKWGCLIGIGMGIVGYYAGNATNGVANQGGFPGNLLSSSFGGESSSKHNRQTKSRIAAQKMKPKPLDPLQQWLYNEAPTNPHAQQIMDSIVHAAEQALEGDWWRAFAKLGRRGAAENSGERVEGKVGKSRSR